MCIGSDRVCIEQQMLRLHRDRLNVLLRGVDYLMLGEGMGWDGKPISVRPLNVSLNGHRQNKDILLRP